MKRLSIFGAAVLIGAAFPEAQAAPVIFTAAGTGPGGVPVSASAAFDLSGNTLTITLSNTTPAHGGKDVPGSTLTGLFWDLPGNPVLLPVSATLGSGAAVVGPACSQSSCVGVANLDGEFGYQAAALPGGADRGISSSGYLTTGLAGDIGNFNHGLAGVNLDGPASLDGINFGLISTASFAPNGGLDKVPLVAGPMVFVLSGVAGLSASDIGKVSFQYGTAMSELNLPDDPPGVPVSEPPTLLLLASAPLMLWAAARRRVPGAAPGRSGMAV